MRGGLRCDEGWGCAACGKVPATGDGALEDALGDAGCSAGGSAFDETRSDGIFSFGVSEKKMLDDLLDAPLGGICRGAELSLSGIERADRGGDPGLELMEGGVHLRRITLHRAAAGRYWNDGLLQLGEGLLCGFGFFTFRVELEVSLVLSYGFVFLLHLLRDLGQSEVSGGVIGLDGNGIFGAEVGALIVFVAHIELCDVEVFVNTLVVGLDSLDLGEFPVDGGSFGHISVGVGGSVGLWSRVVAARA